MLWNLFKFWVRFGSSCRSSHLFATDCLTTGYSYNMSCLIHSCFKLYIIISNFISVKLTIIKIVYSSFRKYGTAVCCKNASFSLIKLCLEHWNCDCYQNCDDCDNNQEFCQGEGFLFLSFFIIGICLSPFYVALYGWVVGPRAHAVYFLPFEQNLTLDAQALGFVQR